MLIMDKLKMLRCRLIDDTKQSNKRTGENMKIKLKLYALSLVLIFVTSTSTTVSPNVILINNQTNVTALNEETNPNMVGSQNVDRIAHSQVKFGIHNLTQKSVYNKFELTLNEDRFEIEPVEVVKMNMDIYFVVDEKGIFSSAKLDQIYNIQVRINHLDKNIFETSLITNKNAIWLSFYHNNKLYELAPDGDTNAIHNLFQTKSLKVSDKKSEIDNLDNTSIQKQSTEQLSSSSESLISSTNQNQNLGLSATNYYPNLVLAGSSSFYSAYGSNWAAQITSIFNGGGDEDMYDMFADLNIYWNLRRVFTFTSGGPSSVYAGEFLDEYVNFVKGLSYGDPMFPFHSTYIFSGHDFQFNTQGAAYINEFADIWHPSILDDWIPMGVVEARSSASLREIRWTLTHEAGHTANADHIYSSSYTKTCYWWIFRRYTTAFSVMAWYYDGPFYCSSGRDWSDFYWSTTNTNRVTVRISGYI